MRSQSLIIVAILCSLVLVGVSGSGLADEVVCHSSRLSVTITTDPVLPPCCEDMTVTVTVRDSNGHLLPDAAITLTITPYLWHPFEVLGTTGTDGQFNFIYRPVWAGEFKFEAYAEHPDFLPARTDILVQVTGDCEPF